MSNDVTIKNAGEISYYQGPGAIPGIKFRLAGRELGVTAWGMNVVEIEAGCSAYPEHDHSKDGQEEVYVILKGSATLSAGGTERRLEAGTLVRVGPTTRRKFIPGPQGVALLVLGGTPGKAYEPRR
jgi:uncharacterized cupin superfamily protein